MAPKVYEIEKLVKRRWKRDKNVLKPEYLVKWKGPCVSFRRAQVWASGVQP